MPFEGTYNEEGSCINTCIYTKGEWEKDDYTKYNSWG